MRVLFLLDRVAAIVRRIEQLAREPVNHRLLAAPACVLHYPADGQRSTPLLVYLNRNLVGGTADAARLDFDRGPDILDRALENLERLFAGLITDARQRVIEDSLGCGLLTAPHHAVDELRHQRIVIDRVGQHFASFGNSSSWHNQSLKDEGGNDEG